jgi:CDP-glucose 4,6-dehydratase
MVTGDGWWRGRRVLVTGHTGFKGAWLSLVLELAGAEVTGLALPPEDAAGAFTALGPWSGLDSHEVDLRDAAAVARTVAGADPEVILHLGAQALVRRAYAEPAATWAVNAIGTANVLDAARAAPSLRAVVVVTSDKVYANAGAGHPFREDDRLGGHDPYSSSKAGAELVTASWRQSFFADGRVGIATARAGNVIGGGDRGEDRLLADVWRALEAGDTVGIRYPQATRPWQFVLEPLSGYLLLAEHLATTPATTLQAVNFGPDPAASWPVAAVVERTFALWGGGRWERVGGPQPAEATTLSVDAGLAQETLGWKPRLDLDTALAWTTAWWRCRADGGDLRALARAQIDAYRGMDAA